ALFQEVLELYFTTANCCNSPYPFSRIISMASMSTGRAFSPSSSSSFTPRWKYDVFLKAFAKHEERFEENIKKVQKWRDALREAGNLSGWHLQDRSEAEYIDNVLTKNTGTEAIQGIVLKLHEPKKRVPFKIVDIKFPIKEF
ncbi:hypothetical protein CMV_027116, partial [Castanea mollissima]